MTFETLGIVVSVITVVVAGIALLVNTRDAANSRDLLVVLDLSASYRNYWEGGWATALDELESHIKVADAKAIEPHLRRTVYSHLNWIDWYGNILSSGVFRQSRIFTLSVGPSMKRALNLTKPLVDEDIKANGAEYWAGLRRVEKELEKLPGTSGGTSM